ncbi:hypothetical protein PV963_03275 [Streptomyces coeruleorubidus]|nr:hypothetical protein [Streptomyces coeruleorubidus]WDV49468.1 hypothetical protein PV963_03275 [Streptomyces coeruleorubidus]
MISRPNTTPGAASLMSWATLGTYITKAAPSSGPYSEASPPTTRPASRVMDRTKLNESGETKPITQV